MTKEFWTVREVVEFFEIEERFLIELEEEEVLCPICRDDSPTKLFSSTELEKLRLAKILIEDMGVNLPGVEVILRMRQTMFEMRRQFDEILEDLARHLQRDFGRED
ncbi:MAG: chaperone modulator CbpM [Desulfobacteraceae bacterium]|jgi:MerR family transcriptional regulator/heat shock protein HspR